VKKDPESAKSTPQRRRTKTEHLSPSTTTTKRKSSSSGGRSSKKVKKFNLDSDEEEEEVEEVLVKSEKKTPRVKASSQSIFAGSASTYLEEDNKRLRDEIVSLRAEVKELQEKLIVALTEASGYKRGHEAFIQGIQFLKPT
jgi:hypothetical protein